LLIREDVVIEAGLKLMPKLDYAQLKIIFDFNSWFKNECETLGSLFKLYAAARCADTRIQTVGFSVQSLFIDTASGPMICKKKTLARFIHIAKKVAKLKGIDWLRNIVEKINKRSNGMSYHKIVSGKDYLMPLLLLRMKRLFSFRGTVEQLKAELASVWPGGNEYTISRALKDI
jgi:hypothetical protein